MLAKTMLSRILDDDALTRGLGDPEARLLVEWLVERVEWLDHDDAAPAERAFRLDRLWRRGRTISCFVRLWGTRADRGAALQLVASERLAWPLPTTAADPCELMQSILHWEDHNHNSALNARTPAFP